MNVKKSGLYFILLSLILGCQPHKSKSDSQIQQPNFFLYLADDLSYNDLGINGNPFVETGVIDSFASQAIAFNKMYTPSSMCAPSRSALFTGLYPHRNGCHMNHGSVKEGVRSLPSYLSDLGYKVALVGKRHIKPEKAFPFDYVDYDELDTYLSQVRQPICVIYASNEPHGPHQYGKHDMDKVLFSAKWLDTPSTRHKLTGYYADIKTMNREFDDFLSQIKKYDLDKKAITIFTSDHGFEYFAKWSCYEAGLKVPFYMKANGLSFKATSIDQLTSFVDVVPTFIELAGGDPPSDIDGISMVPHLNSIKSTTHKYIYGAHTTRGIYSGLAYPIRSITDGKWKYMRNLNHESQFQNILTNGWSFDATPTEGAWAEWMAMGKSKGVGHQWAIMYQSRPEEELYDLSKDPDEKHNLASSDDYINIKSQLSSQLSRWQKEQGDEGMISEMSVPLKARDMSKVPKG